MPAPRQSLASFAPTKFTIPNTHLILKGFASPGAFVQIFDGNALIGTIVADSNGIFEKRFSAIEAGLHNIRLQFLDSKETLSDAVSQTINVRPQATTALEYFLAPTMTVDPTVVNEGELVSLFGYTLPNATVEIVLDGGATILRPQSDQTGFYSISVSTKSYYFGIHTARASAMIGGLKSYQTEKHEFTVNPQGTDNSPEPTNNGQQPPIILNGGTRKTDEETNLIEGTAAAHSQIIIYMNGEPIGSTFASENGGWFFNAQLTEAISEFRAASCQANICSNFSNAIIYKFIGTFGRCSNFQFSLQDYRFFDQQKNDGLDIRATGMSGVAPYEVLIDWGDTITEHFNHDSAESVSIHHVYNETGLFNGTVTFADANGCMFNRYFSVQATDAGFDFIYLTPLAALPFVGWFVSSRRKQRVRQARLAR